VGKVQLSELGKLALEPERGKQALGTGCISAYRSWAFHKTENRSHSAWPADLFSSFDRSGRSLHLRSHSGSRRSGPGQGLKLST
jgi:hypothetical protein